MKRKRIVGALLLVFALGGWTVYRCVTTVSPTGYLVATDFEGGLVEFSRPTGRQVTLDFIDGDEFEMTIDERKYSGHWLFSDGTKVRLRIEKTDGVESDQRVLMFRLPRQTGDVIVAEATDVSQFGAMGMMLSDLTNGREHRPIRLPGVRGLLPIDRSREVVTF